MTLLNKEKIKQENNSSKSVSKIIAYILLSIFTFGIMVYGFINKETRGLVFQGSVYEQVSYNTFKNKSNHHIYINQVNDEENLVITIIIENDDAVITFEDQLDDFTIEKDGNFATGSLEANESESYHILKDYFDLTRSYIKYELTIDEFPEMIIYPFFAISAFLFGFLLIRNVYKNKESARTVNDYLVSIIFFALFITSLGLLILFVVQNT